MVLGWGKGRLWVIFIEQVRERKGSSKNFLFVPTDPDKFSTTKIFFIFDMKSRIWKKYFLRKF